MSVRNIASHFHFTVHFNVTSYTIHRYVSDLSPPTNEKVFSEHIYLCYVPYIP